MGMDKEHTQGLTGQVEIPGTMREMLENVNRIRKANKLQKLPVRVFAQTALNYAAMVPEQWQNGLEAAFEKWKAGQKPRGVKPGTKKNKR